MDETEQELYAETIHTFLTLYRYLRRYSCEMQSQGLSGRKIAALRYLLEAGALSIGQLRDYLYINDSTYLLSLSSRRLENRLPAARSFFNGTPLT